MRVKPAYFPVAAPGPLHILIVPYGGEMKFST